MSYTVIVTKPAELELRQAALWWANNRSEEQANGWYDGFIDAIYSLENDPRRCPIARENDFVEKEIRELHYGLGSRPTHRAVFEIQGNRVLVLTIRHAAQQDLTPEDLQ